jgi:2,5-furandicarboxylate decarboxylase 1
MASQQSLPDFVTQFEKVGFLVRVTDEKRVDEIPGILEANPTKAILIETDFLVLANAYSNQDMYAWAMECDKTQTDPLHAAAPPS